jgi:uncharacterized membrane protein
MRAMNESNRSRSLRPRVIIGLGVLAIVLVAAASILGAGLGGDGACGYVPPDRLRPVPILSYVKAYAPPLVTFFVLAYFALGRRSRTGRMLFGVLTVTLTVFVTFATVVTQVGCGF